MPSHVLCGPLPPPIFRPNVFYPSADGHCAVFWPDLDYVGVNQAVFIDFTFDLTAAVPILARRVRVDKNVAEPQAEKL